MKITWEKIAHHLSTGLWIVFKTILLVLLQAIIYITISDYECAPSQLLGAARFRGPSSGITALLFALCLLILCNAYTLIGCILIKRFGLFSRKFNHHFLWWYLAYSVLSTAGFVAATEAWFWAGFGWYLVDILLAPFFLMTIFALQQFIPVKIKKIRSSITNFERHRRDLSEN